MEQALFAAGCTGGTTKNPTWDDVNTHTTGHAEAVWVEFDAKQVSYETLARQFFHMHDPTQPNQVSVESKRRLHRRGSGMNTSEPML